MTTELLEALVLAAHVALGGEATHVPLEPANGQDMGIGLHILIIIIIMMIQQQ